MTTSIQFWDFEVWEFLVALAGLFLAMLIANGLRRTIPFLKKSLIPSSVIGGFLILAFIGIFRAISGKTPFNTATMEMLTYHGLGLGVVAMTFQNADRRSGKEARRDVFNSSLITVSTYLLQGVVGLCITIVLFYLLGSWAQSGILLPMGYGQGPGQAFNWGTTYMNNYGFEHGSSFGLSVAVSRCAFIKKDPVLLDCFNYRFICIQYTNFMLLQKIACIAASDCSASYKSDSHDQNSFLLIKLIVFKFSSRLLLICHMSFV